jgi:3'-phosphoadenosine 5'-phosphosulfate sulfotransferase
MKITRGSKNIFKDIGCKNPEKLLKESNIKLKNKGISSIFGKKIAKVMMELKSSHCYFILQMAFGEELSWSDAEKLMEEVINEK